MLETGRLSTGEIMDKYGVDKETAWKIRDGRILPQDEKKEAVGVNIPKEDLNDAMGLLGVKKGTVKKPSLGQIDALIRTLNQLGEISDHWELSKSWNQLGEMTIKQYRYLNWLRDEKNLFKINSVLENLKIERK